MTKSYCLTLIFLFFGLCCYGQQEQMEKIYLNHQNHKWLLDVKVGANIDLISSSSLSEPELFDLKPKVVPVTGLRLTYLFSKKVGVYARFQVNIYKCNKSEYYPSGFVDDMMEGLVDAFFPLPSLIHPALDIGVIYRFEQNRWKVHPGVGIGYMTYLPNRDLSKSVEKDGIRCNLSYKQQASSLLVNFGLSTRYLISNNGSLLLDINFQQPLQKSSAELIVSTDQVYNKMFYETSTAGRNINISIGYGFVF